MHISSWLKNWQRGRRGRVDSRRTLDAAEQLETRSLLSALIWHPVDSQVAEEAGALGRRWHPSHHTIDSADLAIAATVQLTGLPLLTKNVRHFPMFSGLKPPY